MAGASNLGPKSLRPCALAGAAPHDAVKNPGCQGADGELRRGRPVKGGAKSPLLYPSRVFSGGTTRDARCGQARLAAFPELAPARLEPYALMHDEHAGEKAGLCRSPVRLFTAYEPCRPHQHGRAGKDGPGSDFAAGPPRTARPSPVGASRRRNRASVRRGEDHREPRRKGARRAGSGSATIPCIGQERHAAARPPANAAPHGPGGGPGGLPQHAPPASHTRRHAILYYGAACIRATCCAHTTLQPWPS